VLPLERILLRLTALDPWLLVRTVVGAAVVSRAVGRCVCMQEGGNIRRATPIEKLRGINVLVKWLRYEDDAIPHGVCPGSPKTDLPYHRSGMKRPASF
jgi:hypothetical protein